MAVSAPCQPPGPDRDGYVCSCLRVTECELLAALAGSRIATIRELRRTIGAGDGCTACHQSLTRYLDGHHRAQTMRPAEPGAEPAVAGPAWPARRQASCPPICSAR